MLRVDDATSEASELSELPSGGSLGDLPSADPVLSPGSSVSSSSEAGLGASPTPEASLPSELSSPDVIAAGSEMSSTFEADVLEALGSIHDVIAATGFGVAVLVLASVVAMFANLRR